MANFLNFEVLEVSGANKNEAMAKTPFTIMGDATQAYKIWKAKNPEAVTEAAKKQFMIDYLAAKSNNVPGGGYFITVESAVADTRERPYTIEDITNTKGKRKYTTVYQLVDDATGTILADVEGTKQKAMELAKEIIVNGFHGKGTCLYTKQVTEGENVAFRFSYTPSKGTKPGAWIVFGIKG